MDWWMSENLKYRTTTGSYIYQNRDYTSAIGFLYTFQAPIGSAPSGWYVPSDEEWKKLERCLGMKENTIDKDGNRSGNISYRMTEFCDSRLNVNHSGAASDSIVPGFYFFIKVGYYWTSTEIDTTTAWCREFNQWPSPARYKYNKLMKFSVRCIKNTKRKIKA